MATRTAPDEKKPGVAKSLDDLLSRDGPAFVRAAYRTLLRREPDLGGFVAYLDKLKGGMTKRDLIDELCASAEGRRCGARIPGLDTTTGAAAPNPIAATGSIEELLSLSGAPFVSRAYLHLLGRAADTAGMAHYSTQLARGAAKTQILAEIALSEEYLRRNRPVKGLDPIVQRHLRLQHPVLKAARRLLGLVRAMQVGRTAPTAVVAPVQAEPAPAPALAPERDAVAQALPANPSRTWLLTLPTLQQRAGKDRA